MSDMQVAAISAFFDNVTLATLAFLAGWFCHAARAAITKAKGEA